MKKSFITSEPVLLIFPGVRPTREDLVVFLVWRPMGAILSVVLQP